MLTLPKETSSLQMFTIGALSSLKVTMKGMVRMDGDLAVAKEEDKESTE